MQQRVDTVNRKTRDWQKKTAERIDLLNDLIKELSKGTTNAIGDLRKELATMNVL